MIRRYDNSIILGFRWYVYNVTFQVIGFTRLWNRIGHHLW